MGQNLSYLVRYVQIWAYSILLTAQPILSNFDKTYINVFRRLVAKSRAPHGFGHFKVIWQNWAKYGRGCPVGTDGHPDFGTPSKVWSQAQVSWSTAISKTSFTKNQGDPYPPLTGY